MQHTLPKMARATAPGLTTNAIAGEVLRRFFHDLSVALSDGGTVQIHNFGTITAKRSKPAMRRNPKTGEVKMHNGGKLRVMVKKSPTWN